MMDASQGFPDPGGVKGPSALQRPGVFRFYYSGIIKLMNPAIRLGKQLIYLAVFLFVVGSICYLGYRWMFPYIPPPTPTPTPTINNIEIISSKLFSSAGGDYDFLAQVRNPNADFGSPEVDYEVTFTGDAGPETRTGSFYIMPGQTKYVVLMMQRFSQPVTEAAMKIKSIDWKKLNPLAPAGISLTVRNPVFVPLNQPGVYAKARSDVFNDSGFDLNLVDIVVVLMDANNEPISVNTSEIRTVLSKTNRGFEAVWTSPVSGQVSRVVVEANANVFGDENFIKAYGGEERFQQMY
ncbi:MAG: hypothetical protein CEN90_412 [Parcubacteria group bacterium Licking1014_17]|nr:MAG: hypothetical protein CEN90_412 [Parcubacteria group bacterium Licking1014_17]